MLMKKFHPAGLTLLFMLSLQGLIAQTPVTRTIASFDKDWRFHLGDAPGANAAAFDDATWRNLALPHDWSIEGKFDKDNPAGTGGGALPGGVGWYRKTFTVPASSKGRHVFIDFDGIYRKSEVWINGHSLGMRPNGYISFRYELTPFLKYGGEKNCIAVRVDNSQQPNSRWYSGSGIYRNVWLVTTGGLFVDHWGTYITTPKIDDQSATIAIRVRLDNPQAQDRRATVRTTINDAEGGSVGSVSSEVNAKSGSVTGTAQAIDLKSPRRWSLDDPYLYRAVTEIFTGGKLVDSYETFIGIRSFIFDKDKGFLLNGKPVKINGVCDHHDLGCLGSAINYRALQRQLEILKAMGCNGIRTSHNPPAPELLDLCDRMGFIVMDEAFDMWKQQKTKYDYHLDWDQWHKKDLEDQILRDRNHPSVFIWSIGNEIPEQWSKDSSGDRIAAELGTIVRSLDATRPITSALNNHNWNNNGILRSGALDLVGYNYDQKEYPDFPKKFPGKKFIATETVSALETRGHYDMPSDSIRRWPTRWDKPFEGGNKDFTVSAYDNVSAPWGSTHEETWKVIKKYDFLSGQFIWTGFDYIGEPTPYPWPARSSYFGIIDLAGFPKDLYYMYQSEWTDKPVLHIFPHWNWRAGDTIDVWAYYNQADEVELFLNGKSLGVRAKHGDDLHVMWRVPYQPGTLSAVSRRNGATVLTGEIRTAGKPAAIVLQADREKIKADGDDLSFLTAKVVDAAGVIVPDADNLIRFATVGEGTVIATDNGNETSMESFKASQHRAFNGLCLAVIRSSGRAGHIQVTATAEGLPPASLTITAENTPIK
ncbi:MAG: beta-galactosidase GalB [Bacteroidota bacterium]|nr:beta-galactosidase GalB [Bacteroidota bacterium]MDP4246015.1 beta-galactosidase GalB [Bacteroidota bacterium]